MKFPSQLLIFLFLVIACSQPKKTKSKQTKTVKSEAFFKLQINSIGQFSATLSTKKRASDNKNDLLKFNGNDSIGRLWHLKINTEKNWTFDSSFHVLNLGGMKKQLNDLFGKIPFEAPKNCNFQFQKNKFVPIEAVAGNQLDTNKLTTIILNKLKHQEVEFSINYDNCYKKPSYYLKDAAAEEGLKKLKKCLRSEITYKLPNTQIKITKNDFAEWLTLDSNMRVDLINSKGARFIQKIARQHDIIEKNIIFTTNSGEQKTINSSELGTRIDIYRELYKLQKDIASGEKVEREPIYGMKGIPFGAFDSNKNYVEVSISDQKLWYYKNGQLITESNVVTGCPRRGHATNTGAFYVKYKERNAILDGLGYRSYVRWWMPFNNGIGLHDARWRRKFGGEIYKADGSHGCVNLPSVTAQLLYEHIQPGSIVICY